MRLTRTDVAILKIMLRFRSDPTVESMIDVVFERGRHFRRMTNIFNVRYPAISRLLGISGTTFPARFESHAPLVKSGLVSIDEDGDASVVDLYYLCTEAMISAKSII